jgi:hypothetical protein
VSTRSRWGEASSSDVDIPDPNPITAARLACGLWPSGSVASSAMVISSPMGGRSAVIVRAASGLPLVRMERTCVSSITSTVAVLPSRWKMMVLSGAMRAAPVLKTPDEERRTSIGSAIAMMARMATAPAARRLDDARRSRWPVIRRSITPSATSIAAPATSVRCSPSHGSRKCTARITPTIDPSVFTE